VAQEDAGGGMTQSLGDYDYVVVGAGSSGSVVAARLSESGMHRVALLEAGGKDDNFWLQVPLGFGKLYHDERFNWLYEGEPEPELEGSRSFQPRGKVLGGTSSINGMVVVRGQREDFDWWRQLGNVGWSYDDVLPYFKKLEHYTGVRSAYRGVGGPVHVMELPRHELADAFIRAGEEAGYQRNIDFNGETQDGFGYNQVSIQNGRRCSTAVAYLRPAEGRKNLNIVTGALASRVLFEGRRAIGIEVLRNGVPYHIAARREVIISGGVFNSPQLLQLSGIGPALLLQQCDVPVVADLPGVGENLQDHFTATIDYRCTKPVTVNDAYHNPLRRIAMGLHYLAFRRGPMATNATLAGGCIRTEPSLVAPDVKLHLQLWSRAAGLRSKGHMALHPFSSFGVSMNIMHPDSRGTVRIVSNNPVDHPRMIFNFFVTDHDRQTSVRALRAIRRVMAAPAVAPYVAEEFSPGLGCATDEELIDFCRHRGRSNHHATSSCKMGVDPMAVVDPRLRVHGIGSLRVVDASIMPRIVAGNTNAASIMIGEKGAAMVLEDAMAS
jgi:choline dehydrogenase